MTAVENLDAFVMGGKTYDSRLLVGTGKYKDFAETRAAIETSGARIVTVAIRRTNIGQNANEPNLLDAIPPSKYTILPNTAGCYTADDAVRTLVAAALVPGRDATGVVTAALLRQRANERLLRLVASDLDEVGNA